MYVFQEQEHVVIPKKTTSYFFSWRMEGGIGGERVLGGGGRAGFQGQGRKVAMSVVRGRPSCMMYRASTTGGREGGGGY